MINGVFLSGRLRSGFFDAVLFLALKSLDKCSKSSCSTLYSWNSAFCSVVRFLTASYLSSAVYSSTIRSSSWITGLVSRFRSLQASSISNRMILEINSSAN